MKKILLIATAISVFAAGKAYSQTVKYSENHTGGSASTTQCAAWGVFQSQLNPGNYLKMTIKGTYDPVGLVCTDKTVVNAMAQAIKTASTYISPLTNGHVWSVCNRYSGEVWVDPPSSCSGSNCPNPGYILRPCIGGTNPNWGGVNTATCGAPTQVMTIEFWYGFPCDDVPKTDVNGPLKVCPNKEFTLQPTKFFADATYKWEYSNNGTTWSNYVGTVDPNSGGIKDKITAERYYRVTITCNSNSAFTYTTPAHKVSIAPFYYCYCDNMVEIAKGKDIGNVKVINTQSGDTVLNYGNAVPLYSNTDAGNVYSPNHDSVAWPCLYKDTTYKFAITQISSGSTFTASWVQAYIDFNRDGVYNYKTERLFSKALDGTGNPPEVFLGSYKIPTDAEIGPTGLRVILSDDSVEEDPCGEILGEEGEVEDYIVEICYRPCDGPVISGIAVSTDSSMCSDYEYVITDTSYEKKRSLFTWSWQVSGDNISWFPVNNSFKKDTLQRVFTGQPLFYRMQLVCQQTQDTTYSQIASVNIKPGYKCYCYSKAVGGFEKDTSDIGGITIASFNSNSGGPHVLNPIAHASRTDHTDATPVDIFTDSAYKFYVFHSMPVAEHGDAKITVFMDFNNNHEYDIPEERVYTGFTSIGNHTVVDNIIVPETVITDVPTGMRFILNNDVGPNSPSDSACGPYESGETEDFIVIFRKKYPTGISSTQKLTGFGVHPNPSSGKFHLEFNTPFDISEVNVSITTVTGQVVYSNVFEHKGGTFDKEVNLEGHAKGVYLVELQADGQRFVRKIVLQ